MNAPKNAPKNAPMLPLMLPGQAAAPEGPVDMTVMYVMHHGFRRDLARFARAVPATPPSESAAWQRLAARWRVLTAVLHHHHAGEDAGLWPALLERADRAEMAVLEAMEAEHDRLDPLLAEVGTGLAALATDPSVEARAVVADRVAACRDALEAHLAHEERDAIAMVQRHLTQREWRALEKRAFGGRPPAGTGFLVCWFLEDVPADLVGQVVASVGAPVRVIWALRRRAFRRSEAAVFGPDRVITS